MSKKMTVSEPSLPVEPLTKTDLPSMLTAIRTHATSARYDTARTIAELETWRSEIDATIAFLKGRNGS